MGDVQVLVDAKIAGKKVMIFSKSFCPSCKMTKDTMKHYLGKDLEPEDYEVMEIDGRPDCQDIQSYLGRKTGANTVPRVFIKGKCVGGGSDVTDLHKEGKLAKLLS